jgi:hypothetical protein
MSNPQKPTQPKPSIPDHRVTQRRLRRPSNPIQQKRLGSECANWARANRIPQHPYVLLTSSRSGVQFMAIPAGHASAFAVKSQATEGRGPEKLFWEPMMSLKIQQLSENPDEVALPLLTANLFKISELKKWRNGGKGSENNSENEGITQDVDENKGRFSTVWG